jgi:hypothetical protein
MVLPFRSDTHLHGSPVRIISAHICLAQIGAIVAKQLDRLQKIVMLGFVVTAVVVNPDQISILNSYQIAGNPAVAVLIRPPTPSQVGRMSRVFGGIASASIMR